MDGQVKAFKHPLGTTGGIAEPDVLELNLSFEFFLGRYVLLN